jgi:hypothetical protein
VYSAKAYKTKRERHESIRAQLTTERQSFIPHWRDLADHIIPTRARFQLSDANRGDRRNLKIVDATATYAARTLQSGMMSGVTSPARPWFRFTTPEPDLAEQGSVKTWLHAVTQRTQTVLLRSNFYHVLPSIYLDLAVFGTSAMIIEEDFDKVIRCTHFPIGSYMLGKGKNGKISTFFREYRMTVRELVEEFGDPEGRGEIDWSKFSMHVREMWEHCQYESWIDVCHIIEPNPDYRPGRLEANYKKFLSAHYERGTSSTAQSYSHHLDDRYLRESGFDWFPVLCPRWSVTGEDVYATMCPGMETLGDVKALQVCQKRLAQAIEKMVNPPMVGPPELRTTSATLLPGGITYVTERDGQKGFRPAHEVQPRVQELLLYIQDHQNRIKYGFYEPIILMIASSPDTQRTAREIDERHEEKFLVFGPVLESMGQDLFDPGLDAVFACMERQGYIPEPPEELEGRPLKVEYISIMAQAQKLVGSASIERVSAFVRTTAGELQRPDILDKVDFDQMIDEYADSVGAPPRIIRPDDVVEKIRQGRADAERAAHSAAVAREQAGAMKDLSQADTEGENALTQMMRMAQAGAVRPAVA